MAKILASEEKWSCPVPDCVKKCKVRQLRIHLKTVHKWSGSSFSCQMEGCGWRCSMNMHCIHSHFKTDHPLVSNVTYELVPTTVEDFDKEGHH